MSLFTFFEPFDHAVAVTLFSIHTPAFDTFFSFLTLLGNTWPVTGITILITGWLLLTKKYRYASILAFAVSGAAVTTALLKILFTRARPDVLLNQLDTFSFPSGHATAAIALYGTFVYLLQKTKREYRYTYFIQLFLVLLILLVGFSRLYLGYHYVTDVLVGYAVGAAWICISLWLSSKRRTSL